MEYRNFNLRIESKVSDGYPVVVESEMGETEGRFTLSDECRDIIEQLKDVRSLPTTSPLPRKLGANLYDCLFQKTVGRLLNESFGAVKDDEQGLRIRLKLSPAEIAAVPWEFLYDEVGECFLATSEKTPLTRYIELVEPIKALKIEPPLKVLILIPGQSGLDVENEKRIITQAFANLPEVEMSVLRDKVTQSIISEALNEQRYHILHFIGHGTFENGEGKLVLNSEGDGYDLISAKSFADFFRNYPSLKLVVLNACQGAEVSSTQRLAGVAPQLVARGIPAVVAMQYPISDVAAITFAKEFYLKLCKGSDRGRVDSAISHARNRMNMSVKEPLAFATPVLFLRSPTGVIFDLEQQQSGWLRRVLRLGAASAKQVARLREIRKTHEKNLELLEDRANDPSLENTNEATALIVEEREQLATVDKRIISWNRTFVASVFATLAIFILASIGLLDFPISINSWLESLLIPVMDQYVPTKMTPSVRVILADEGDNGGMGPPGPSWRQYHPALIEALTQAGANVIAFDLQMDSSTEFDSKLAAAITDAESKGTHVILSKSVDTDGRLLRDLAPELQKVTGDRWGNIAVGGLRGGAVRIYQLAQPLRPAATLAGGTAVLPSLALQALLKYQPAEATAAFDKDKEEIQLRSGSALIDEIPVYENSYPVYDFPLRLTSRTKLGYVTDSYADVYGRRADIGNLKQQYAGKIVIIGFKNHDEAPQELPWLHGERRYGAELHANVISNIINGVYIRLLPTSYNLLIIAFMTALGALVRARFSRIFRAQFKLPFSATNAVISISGFLVVADVGYLLIAFILYETELIYMVKYYHLIAPFISYWLTGKMQEKAALSHRKTLVRAAEGVPS